MTNLERRIYSTDLKVERRAAGDAPAIVGHAAVFEQLSVNLGGFREKVQAGAFSKTLREADIRALLNHDPNFVFGRNKNDTLALEEDEIGLAVRIEPPDTQWARDALVSIERGDISQMSFGFRTVKDLWYEDPENGAMVRTLVEVQLYDVSPVTFPAYPQTDVAVRTLGGVAPEEMFRALHRAQYGGLEEADIKLLVTLDGNLRRVLAEPGQASHSAPAADAEPAVGQVPDYAALRRKLDLIIHSN